MPQTRNSGRAQLDRLELELETEHASRSQLPSPVSPSHFNKVSTGTAAAQNGATSFIGIFDGLRAAANCCYPQPTLRLPQLP